MTEPGGSGAGSTVEQMPVIVDDGSTRASIDRMRVRALIREMRQLRAALEAAQKEIERLRALCEFQDTQRAITYNNLAREYKQERARSRATEAELRGTLKTIKGMAQDRDDLDLMGFIDAALRPAGHLS